MIGIRIYHLDTLQDKGIHYKFVCNEIDKGTNVDFVSIEKTDTRQLYLDNRSNIRLLISLPKDTSSVFEISSRYDMSRSVRSTFVDPKVRTTSERAIA